MKRWPAALKLSTLFLGLSLTLATPAFGPPKPLPPHERNAANTAIVVFTGDDRRIIEGMHLYMAGIADTLFITGIDLEKIDVMTLYQNAGYTPLRDSRGIHIDRLAQTTYENAVNTRLWLQGQNMAGVLLVTSDFHMPRSRLLLQKQLGHTNIHIESFSVPSNATAETRKREARKYWFTRRGIPTNAVRLVQLAF